MGDEDLLRLKRIKIWSYITFALALFSISIMSLDYKFRIIITLVAILVVSLYSYRKKIGQELVIASLIALIITSYYAYEYTTNSIFVGRINLFPLVGWTFGLVFLREIYEKLSSRWKFVYSIITYWVLLLILEYVGYNFLGIKLNTNYNRLLGFNVLHGPLFLQITYLLVGPVYLFITDYLKVE